MKPPRMRVYSVRTRSMGQPTWPKRLWLAEPIPGDFEPTRYSYTSQTYGRRTLEQPTGSVLAATWEEAMAYALTGRRPRPLTDIYPSWCGL